MLKDTNVPFRGKLFFTNPIKDFELTNGLIKSASIGLKLDNNVAVLNPHFVTGFVDSEGCFMVNLFKNPN
jgi:hypothetical protein